MTVISPLHLALLRKYLADANVRAARDHHETVRCRAIRQFPNIKEDILAQVLTYQRNAVLVAKRDAAAYRAVVQQHLSL